MKNAHLVAADVRRRSTGATRRPPPRYLGGCPFTKASLLVAVAIFSGALPTLADETKPAAESQRKPGEYPLGPDSLPQAGVPKGKLEGPFLFRSRIFTNTVRRYWVFVPAQYTPDHPACVLVFQDGQRATRTNGALRVPQVMENLIAKKEMPVTIGIFITPGSRGDEYTETGGGNPNNRGPPGQCSNYRKIHRQSWRTGPC